MPVACLCWLMVVLTFYYILGRPEILYRSCNPTRVYQYQYQYVTLVKSNFDMYVCTYADSFLKTGRSSLNIYGGGVVMLIYKNIKNIRKGFVGRSE